MPKLHKQYLHPLYRAEATGLELSYDILDTDDYLHWLRKVMYTGNSLNQ